MINSLSSELIQLLKPPGLPGYENEIRSYLSTLWEPLTDVLEVSNLGSLHGVRLGRGPTPRPALLLAAHMDVIGLMTTMVDDSFLHFTSLGGIDRRILPGQAVMIHGRELLPGVIIQLPDYLNNDRKPASSRDFSNLRVDTGLPGRELNRLVRSGDLIVFDQQPFMLGDHLVGGSGLDNRASLTALTLCLKIIQKSRLHWDLWAVATVQEEISGAGAVTSAFEIEPTLAVAIDVTYGSGPGSPAHKTFPLEGGVTLGWGPDVHPALYSTFAELAEQLEIPYEMEVMPGRSGTDATVIQTSTTGVPTMVISIPIRYMHSPVEIVHMHDIVRAGRLLADFTTSLDAEFLPRLAWQP